MKTSFKYLSFQGYYDTMDSGFRDEDGNIAVMARSDDVINVAGHRLSTGQLEEVRGHEISISDEDFLFFLPGNP